jgi:S-adenosylmethionine synthetase
MFDLTPFAIERDLKLRKPIYAETATYGHMGREPKIVTKHFQSPYQPNETLDMDVELFTWEKLDMVETIKKEFNIQ